MATNKQIVYRFGKLREEHYFVGLDYTIPENAIPISTMKYAVPLEGHEGYYKVYEVKLMREEDLQEELAKAYPYRKPNLKIKEEWDIKI